MTSPSSGYRAVCPLCKTVVVSSAPGGTFTEAGAAIRAMHGHLVFSCDAANGLKRSEREQAAENCVEAVEGAA